MKKETLTPEEIDRKAAETALKGFPPAGYKPPAEPKPRQAPTQKPPKGK